MAKRYRTEEAVKKALEGEKGRIRPDMWQKLIEKDYVKGILDDEEDAWIDACNELDDMRDIASYREPTAGPGRTVAPDEMHKARSRLLAQALTDEPEVRSFRRRHLPDGLLSPEAVAAWIRSHAPQGQPFQWVKAPLPAGVNVREMFTEGPPLELHIERGQATFSADMLQFIDGEAVRTAAVPVAGPLRELYEVAASLKWFYPKQWEAVQFVLTGQVPLLSPLELRSDTYAEPWEHTKVTISVDISVQPAEVAAEYSKLRRMFTGSKRSRPRAPRTLALVHFVLDTPGQKWEARRSAWNTAHPDKPYVTARRMARDYDRAKRSLMT